MTTWQFIASAVYSSHLSLQQYVVLIFQMYVGDQISESAALTSELDLHFCSFYPSLKYPLYIPSWLFAVALHCVKPVSFRTYSSTPSVCQQQNGAFILYPPSEHRCGCFHMVPAAENSIVFVFVEAETPWNSVYKQWAALCAKDRLLPCISAVHRRFRVHMIFQEESPRNKGKPDELFGGRADSAALSWECLLLCRCKK